MSENNRWKNTIIMEPKCLQSRSAESGCFFKSPWDGVSQFICSRAELSDSNMATKQRVAQKKGKKKKEEIHYLAAGNKKGNPGLKPLV